MTIQYDDDSQDKASVYVNGYAISYHYPNWKAVKKGIVHFYHKKKDKVIKWAEAN